MMKKRVLGTVKYKEKQKLRDITENTHTHQRVHTPRSRIKREEEQEIESAEATRKERFRITQSHTHTVYTSKLKETTGRRKERTKED